MKNYSYILLLFLLSFSGLNSQNYPTPVEGDYVIKNFKFQSGEELEKLNLHYITIGEPTRGQDGKVNNAVLIKHGTTGYGKGFLGKRFAGNLFGPGQLLDGLWTTVGSVGICLASGLSCEQKLMEQFLCDGYFRTGRIGIGSCLLFSGY